MVEPEFLESVKSISMEIFGNVGKGWRPCPVVAPNSLSFSFCLSLSNLTNYKSAAFRSLTILNSATISSTNTADS